MHGNAHWFILAFVSGLWTQIACDSSNETDSGEGNGGSTQLGTGGTSVGGNSSVHPTATGGTSSHAHDATAPAGGTTSKGGMMDSMGGMRMSHAGSGTAMTGALDMTAGNAGSSAQGASLEAPVLVSVTPMGGGLHVVWTNQSNDCEKIELSRNKDGGAYALAQVLTGAATSQHDTQATAPGTYCYRARCVIRVHSSAESAALCATLR